MITRIKKLCVHLTLAAALCAAIGLVWYIGQHCFTADASELRLQHTHHAAFKR